MKIHLRMATLAVAMTVAPSFVLAATENQQVDLPGATGMIVSDISGIAISTLAIAMASITLFAGLLTIAEMFLVSAKTKRPMGEFAEMLLRVGLKDETFQEDFSELFSNARDAQRKIKADRQEWKLPAVILVFYWFMTCALTVRAVYVVKALMTKPQPPTT